MAPRAASRLWIFPAPSPETPFIKRENVGVGSDHELDNILDARPGVLEVFDVPGKHGKIFVRHGGGTVEFQEARTRRQARGPDGNSRPRGLDWACLSISRWTPRKLAIVSGLDHAGGCLPEHRDATGFKFGSVVRVPGIS
jgi:hypothetical protein